MQSFVYLQNSMEYDGYQKQILFFVSDFFEILN
jgi:hypothetical protein